jgi:long-subunit fatty acid transport protein
MRYNFGYAFQNEANAVNMAIRNTFKGAANVRIGGEFKINQMAFRGGFNYMGSPYNNAQSKGDRYILSLGTGYRTDTWYMDLTYAHSAQDVYENPYTLSRIGASPAPALLSFRAHQVVLTLGSRF